MNKNRELTALKNMGLKVAGRLNEVGIFSEQELAFYGATEAHRMTKNEYPNEILPVCYYLCSFEGVLNDFHWHEIREHNKQELTKAIFRFVVLECLSHLN